jgi:hypothetical protein
MINPDGLLRPPVPGARVVGSAIASAAAAACALLLVWWAGQAAAGAMGELIEGYPVVMPWLMSLFFSGAGIAGAAICLAYSGRVYQPRMARVAAFGTSWFALLLSIAALGLGAVVVFV